MNIPFLTLDFSKQNGVRVNFRISLRRHKVIFKRATFLRTKASAKWSVTAATHFSVMSCMKIRAQFRLFQVKAMFKQHVNLMIWTWILRLQTALRNKFPCKNVSFQTIHWTWRGHASVTVGVCFYFTERSRSARRKEQLRACSEQTNRIELLWGWTGTWSSAGLNLHRSLSIWVIEQHCSQQHQMLY